jgi:opacity protein-like surface antigen
MRCIQAELGKHLRSSQLIEILTTSNYPMVAVKIHQTITFYFTMKKIHFFVLVLAMSVAAPAFAQLEKGTFVISRTNDLASGNLFSTEFGPGISSDNLASLNFYNPGDDGGNIFQLSSELGYFVNKRVMLGTQLALARVGQDGDSYTLFSLNPLARVYFNPNNPRFNFYGHARALIAAASFDGDSESSFGYGIGLGLSTSLSPGIVLNSEMGLYDSDIDLDDNNAFGISVGLQSFLTPTLRKGHKAATSGFRKGTIMLGASNANYITQKYEETSVNQLSISPQIGYFFTPQLVGGLDLGITHFNVDEFSSTAISFEPNLRYYFNKSRHLTWFAEAGYQYALYKFSFDSDPTFDSESNINAFKAEAGFNLFVTRNIALEVAFGPQFARFSGDDVSDVEKNTIFGTRFGLNYFIGTDGDK